MPSTRWPCTASGRRASRARSRFDAEVARDTGWSRGLVQGETSAIRRLETLREVEIVLRRVARRNRDGAVYVGNVYWYYLDEGRAVEQEIRVRAPR